MSPRLTTPSGSTQLPAPASASGTASIVPQRALPLSSLLVAESFVAVGLTVGLLLDRPGWDRAAAGLAVALVFVVRVSGVTLPRWTARLLGFWNDRRRRKRTTSTLRSEPFDSDLPDGAQIGFHWGGTTLRALVGIQENPEAMSVMGPATTVSGETVSVQMLAGCLRQVDITLDSIDVISQGARSRGHGRIAAIYDAVLGPLPAMRRVRCGLRSAWTHDCAPRSALGPHHCSPRAWQRHFGSRDRIRKRSTTTTITAP